MRSVPDTRFVETAPTAGFASCLRVKSLLPSGTESGTGSPGKALRLFKSRSGLPPIQGMFASNSSANIFLLCGGFSSADFKRQL